MPRRWNITGIYRICRFENNEKLGRLVDSILEGKNFADLDIPFAVVAADACTGEEVVIREGRVADAIRASTAIPAVFEPVKLSGRTLVDGAVVSVKEKPPFWKSDARCQRPD
ncbi:MAG: patatin-like phospholipase family protein [Peptococcaceae bacterium]|nr:patatin-like phospholipase family protein [Peptococcaceae bacterium]